VAAFDADLRAVYARSESGWSLIAGRGRSTYARDRLGGMLGISPPQIERLATPEHCSESLCALRTPDGFGMMVVRDEAGFEQACRPGAFVIAVPRAPPDFAARCSLAVLMDADDRARLGGAMIYENDLRLIVKRAWPGHVRRAWTPRTASPDAEAAQE
jgi:hypothetical protein